MTSREFLRELAYPVMHGGLATAIVFFAVLIQLALAAGLIGLWLLILAGAAGAKFLVLVLRARALGVDPPVPDAGLFNLVDRGWTLAAWLFLAGLFLAGWQVSLRFGVVAGQTVALAGLFVFPAAVLRLAVTRTALEMLRPLAILKVIRQTGVAYGAIFAGAGLIALAVRIAGHLLGAPGFAGVLAAAWALVTLFSLGGAVFYARRLALDLPVERSPEKARARAQRLADRDRREVLDHTYGLASRGNRREGVSHLRGWLERTDADLETWAWFYERLGRWESPRIQVEFGREYIGRLAHSGAWTEAIEVAGRCLALDSDFRPRAADREGLLAAARLAGALEMVGKLGGDTPRGAKTSGDGPRGPRR